MGHKRHKIKGDFSNVNPGRGGPGITEDGYPPHLVVVSVEHPEINPKGVTVETFIEEVTEEEAFGTNVGEAIEDLINEEINQTNNNPNKEDTIMNNEQNNTNEKTETINNTNNVNQENINMNNAKETVNNNNPNNMNTNNTKEENNMNNNNNVNPNGTIDDGSNNVNVNPKPSLAKEAASAFVVGAAYGAGTITAVIGISLLAAGIRKLCSDDATATGDAAATAAETTETVAEAFLR